MTMTSTWRLASRDVTNKLPVELLLNVLHRVEDRTDLLQTSLLSRRWRNIALQDDRYYFVFRHAFIQPDRVALKRLNAIGRHVVQHSSRLKLDLRIDKRGWRRTRSLKLHLDIIGAVVSSTLSNMIELSFTILPEQFNCLMGLLKTRAPQLQKLNLSAAGDCGENLPSNHGSVIPTDVFAGDAPALTFVTLTEIGIGAQPIPAFRSVSRQEFNFYSAGAAPSVVSQLTMPMLRELDISTFDENSFFNTRLVDVRDATLTTLSLYDAAYSDMFDWVCEGVLRAADTVVFGVGFEHRSVAGLLGNSGDTGLVTLDLSMEDNALNILSWELYNVDTERNIVLQWDYDDRSTFDRIVTTNDIAQRLTCIYTNAEFLPDVLSCGQNLDALNELEVRLKKRGRWDKWPFGYKDSISDCRWVDTPDESEWTLGCPRLATVRVSAPRKACAGVSKRMLELLSAALQIGSTDISSAVALELAFVKVDGGLRGTFGRFSAVSCIE